MKTFHINLKHTVYSNFTFEASSEEEARELISDFLKEEELIDNLDSEAFIPNYTGPNDEEVWLSGVDTEINCIHLEYEDEEEDEE